MFFILFSSHIWMKKNAKEGKDSSYQIEEIVTKKDNKSIVVNPLWSFSILYEDCSDFVRNFFYAFWTIGDNHFRSRIVFVSPFTICTITKRYFSSVFTSERIERNPPVSWNLWEWSWWGASSISKYKYLKFHLSIKILRKLKSHREITSSNINFRTYAFYKVFGWLIYLAYWNK